MIVRVTFSSNTFLHEQSSVLVPHQDTAFSNTTALALVVLLLLVLRAVVISVSGVKMLPLLLSVNGGDYFFSHMNNWW